MGLEEGQQETRHLPSDIQSHLQKSLVPAIFKSLRSVKGCHKPRGQLPGKCYIL